MNLKRQLNEVKKTKTQNMKKKKKMIKEAYMAYLEDSYLLPLKLLASLLI